jgi:hypothetical protein
MKEKYRQFVTKMHKNTGKMHKNFVIILTKKIMYVKLDKNEFDTK